MTFSDLPTDNTKYIYILNMSTLAIHSTKKTQAKNHILQSLLLSLKTAERIFEVWR